MTTTCTDGKVIASDSGIALNTAGGEVMRERAYGAPKVWRHKDSIYGYCGTTSLLVEFQEFVEQCPEKNRPFMSSSCMRGMPLLEAIEVDGTGHVWYWGDGFRRAPHTPPDAIGSGQVIAHALLLSGFDPRYAVKIAARLDTGTSLPVTFLLIDEDIEEKFTTQRLKNGQWVQLSSYTGRIVDMGFDGQPS